MCCDKCVKKVGKALEDLEGVRDVILDQSNQLVTIHGNVDPERALRRVRRVKKRSQFWKMATQPLQYSGSPATDYVPSKSLVNEYRAPVYRTSAYRAPGYHTSAYRAPGYYSSAYRAPHSQYLSPPRYTSSYSRTYSSPYIDSAYRSGYVEPRGVYNPYARFAYDDLEYRSRFDRGTPYMQMSDGF
jgi:copper chaperone CopZ